VELPRDLRETLDAALSGAPVRAVAAAVDRLIRRYREGGPTPEAILTGSVDVLAYAAYRMPATYAAVRTALMQVRLASPALDPGTQLDIGGGTGAATWAVADAFPELSGVTVLDRVAGTLDLGQRLVAGSTRPALRGAAWLHGRSETAALPAADLVTVSYLLGELTEPDRADLVTRAARASTGAVLVVEPGTPAGYTRVLAARDQLLAAGLHVVAPCPHDAPCPIVPGRDWCHFVARVNRSGLHRRVKGGELSYEDEKFSYVAAMHGGAPKDPAARVLRHPVQRKGLVSLQLCTVDRTMKTVLVSKRQGERYRAARDVVWGDPWST
jgi:ribosomal protein RSM22 (predicted rRNA methylase)